MKHATSELIGHALNRAVAKALGWIDYPNDSIERGSKWHCDPENAPFGRVMWKENFSPSTNWSQGGPIIEREKIDVFSTSNGNLWCAQSDVRVFNGYGPTPLIAAMRCYVASKLGDEVEIPEELCTSPSSTQGNLSGS